MLGATYIFFIDSFCAASLLLLATLLMEDGNLLADSFLGLMVDKVVSLAL